MIILRSLQWIAYIPISLAFRILAILFFNWWLPFFSRPIDKHSWLYAHTGPEWGPVCETLPKWASWFDTFDASIDAGWRDQYYPNDWTQTNPPPYWKRKLYQIRWLYRNTTYGFNYYVLGCPVHLDQWSVVEWSNDGQVQQSLFVDKREGWFAYDLRGKHGSYKFGWKMLNYITDTGTIDLQAPSWGPEFRTLYRLGFNPFQRKDLS